MTTPARASILLRLGPPPAPVDAFLLADTFEEQRALEPVLRRVLRAAARPERRHRDDEAQLELFEVVG